MKALLMSRKAGFIRYLLACFMPVVTDLMVQLIFVLMFVCMERKEMAYFKLTVGVCVAAVIINGLLYVVSRLMRIGYMRDILLDIRYKAFDKILNIDYKTFSKASKEVYISHLVNDINTFENNFFLNLLNVIYMGGKYVASDRKSVV